jgi:tripartite-type tricarboxylate transporter receptor subunit TctC
MQGLLPYTHRDFDVLAVPGLTWSVLAVPAKSPFKTVKELVDYAKANPGKLRFSTTTKGAVYWIQAKIFERSTGTKFNLIVNPGGAGYVATQLGGGHADVGIAAYKPLMSQVDAGNIRVLGTMTNQRVPGFTHLPTLKEQGFDLVLAGWSAHVAPKGHSPEVLKKLLAFHAKVAASKDWADWCATAGTIASPECVGKEAIRFLDKDGELQRPILEELGAAK